MRVRRTTGTAIGLVVLGACTGGAGSGTVAVEAVRDVRFELLQTFGSDQDPDAGILASVDGVAVDAAGDVYVVDRRANSLVAFASDGSPKWTHEQSGGGPGDLHRARGIAWDGSDRLFVGNQTGTQIDEWTLGGRFVETHLIEGLRGVAPIGFIEPSLLVLAQNVDGEVASRMSVVDVAGDWSVAHQFTVGATPTSSLGTPRVSERLDAKVFGGRIAAGNSGSYELRTFSPAGQLLATVERPEADMLRRPGVHERDGRRVITSFGRLDAPVSIGDYWLVASSWPLNVDDPDDYARRQWERLDVPFPRWANAIELVLPGEGVVWSSVTENARRPEIGTPVLAHDTTGAIYTVVDFPFPQVQLHRVEVLHAPAEESRR